jgi:hypothetical protein
MQVRAFVAYEFAIVSVDNGRPKWALLHYRTGALVWVRSAQPPETVARITTDDVVQGVGKIVRYAVDERSFQFACLSVAQLHAHEEQHAFDEHWLAGRPNMPDCFLGITQSTRVVGGRMAGRLQRPKINPRRLGARCGTPRRRTSEIARRCLRRTRHLRWSWRSHCRTVTAGPVEVGS